MRSRKKETTGPTRSERTAEAALDAAAWPSVRALTFVPSLPGGFKSFYATESRGWSATLKVDYDDERTKPNEYATRAVSKRLALRGIYVAEARAYRTRKGSHLRVWLASTRGALPLHAVTVCELQELLGDDPYRVAFNRERIKRQQSGWNVLWTEKYRNGKLVSHETYDAELTAQFREWFGMAQVPQ